MISVGLFLALIIVPGLTAVGVMLIGTGLHNPRDDRKNP